MTDDELERHLQAWFRAEIQLDEAAPPDLRSDLASIPAAVPSPLHRPAFRRPMRLLAVAAIVTTLAAGGLLVASGAFRRAPDTPPSDPAIVLAPTAAPSSPVATPSSSPAPCPSGRPQLLTGLTRPDPGAVPSAELHQGLGVYVESYSGGRRLWAVGPNGRAASLIAGITPVDSRVAVLGIGPRRVSALVSVTVPPVGDRPETECTDLFVLQLDGSVATLVTPDPTNRNISGAAFSRDGALAHVQWNPPEVPAGASVTVHDVASGSTIEQRCDGTPIDGNDLTVRRLVWSPDGRTIAAECQGLLYLVDPTGATPPVTYPRGDYSVAFQWTDDHTLLVARDPGGLALRGLHIDSFDVQTRKSTEVGRVDAPNMEDAYQSFRFSPDGRWLSFQAGVLTAVPFDQVVYEGYVVPVTGGPPTRILTQDEANSIVGWSSDSRALLFVGPDGALSQLDVDSRARTIAGTIPAGYDNGVWQIP